MYVYISFLVCVVETLHCFSPSPPVPSHLVYCIVLYMLLCGMSFGRCFVQANLLILNTIHERAASLQAPPKAG